MNCMRIQLLKTLQLDKMDERQAIEAALVTIQYEAKWRKTCSAPL